MTERKIWCWMQIFLLDTEQHSRSEADGQAWKEDAQWAAILDQDWDLQAVRQVQCLPFACRNAATATLSMRTALSASHVLRASWTALSAPQKGNARGLDSCGCKNL